MDKYKYVYIICAVFTLAMSLSCFVFCMKEINYMKERGYDYKESESSNSSIAIDDNDEVPVYEGVVTDKYSYVSVNYHNTSEVYMIEYEVLYNGSWVKKYQRVTSVVYQGVKIGDKFNALEYRQR